MKEKQRRINNNDINEDEHKMYWGLRSHTRLVATASIIYSIQHLFLFFHLLKDYFPLFCSLASIQDHLATVISLKVGHVT